MVRLASKLICGILTFDVLALSQQQLSRTLSVVGVDVELGMKRDVVLAKFRNSSLYDITANTEQYFSVRSARDSDWSGLIRFRDGVVSLITRNAYLSNGDETVGAIRTFEAFYELLQQMVKKHGSSATVSTKSNAESIALGTSWYIDLEFAGGKRVTLSMIKVDNKLNKNKQWVQLTEEIE